MESPKGWGTDKPINLKAGGVIVHNKSTSEIYAIAETAMAAEWGRADKNGSVFAGVTNDVEQLEQDLKLAEELGEDAHIADIMQRITFAKSRLAEQEQAETVTR
ncbi:MAG: hypothetical protein EBQ80_03920 [Proteobacteria bacterium]|nr:hypothetical protein [Pseudomonadota bacterium]